MSTSGAVHMYELAEELCSQNHQVTVLVPSSNLKFFSRKVENLDNIRVVSLYAPKTKDVNYIRRVYAEFITAYLMFYQFKLMSIFEERVDGIIWYSPTIFFGPLISRLKKKNNCRAYLVLRDMFPDWAVDLGLMKKNAPYYFLKLVEFYQYKVADVIGVQSPGNFRCFKYAGMIQFWPKIELLWSWITPKNTEVVCSVNISNTHLSNRIILVYAGNMGVAQDLDLILDLIELYKLRQDVGFVFIGRGAQLESLKSRVVKNNFSNTLFFDEIHFNQIPNLLDQCHIGIVALDPRHRSNNIPGKFLAYIGSGLPVVARLNEGNDLIDLIAKNKIGVSYVGSDVNMLKAKTDNLIDSLKEDSDISKRCKNLALNLFSTKNAAIQIIKALMPPSES